MAPGILFHDPLDLEGLALERVEIVAEDLDPDLRANAGRQHEQPVLDRLQETAAT